MSNEEVEKALIPFFGGKLPEKAQEKALKKIEKGGKLYLLHILDEAPTRSIRYRTGQVGEESEIVKTFKETQEKVQKEAAKEYVEKITDEAAKYGISVESIFVAGNPADEVLEAVEEYSIDLVLIENLRDKLAGLFHGDEIDFLREETPCEVISI